jgi:hypothetical protein
MTMNRGPASQGVPPSLTDGRTAFWWARASLVGLVVSVLVILVLAGVAYFAPKPTPGWFPVVALLGLVVSPAGFFGIPWFTRIRASIRETQAGYTTLYDRYYDLWQLDPKTGAVLRHPGERVVRR